MNFIKKKSVKIALLVSLVFSPVIIYYQNCSRGISDSVSTSAQSEGQVQLIQSLNEPKVLATKESLQKIRQSLAESPTKEAFEKLIQKAELALTQATREVAELNIPGYYTDKSAHQAAKAAIREDGINAYTLAMAYQLDSSSKKAEYSAKVQEILKAWATVNQNIVGDDGALIMTEFGVYLILAGDLILDDATWSEADRNLFRAWVRNVFLEKASNQIKRRINNWGAWGIFGTISAASFLGDEALVVEEVERIKQYIELSMDDYGEFPEENKRYVKGIWYTYFTLTALTSSAWVAKNAGVDLFHWSAPNGHNLRKALDQHFAYAQDPWSWPYMYPYTPEQILIAIFTPSANEFELPVVDGWPHNLFDAMSVIYNEPSWEAWARTAWPLQGQEVWLYSTLLRPGLK